MPPPNLEFTISTDSPPKIEDLPDDYSVLLAELNEETWVFTVSDDGVTAPMISIHTGAA